MRVQVLIRLKAGVLDVQGKAVEHALHGVGFNDIGQVRVGRLVELEIEAASAEQAKQRAQQVCEKLLANTTIENFEIKVQ